MSSPFPTGRPPGIRIPFFSRTEDGRPLSDAIERASARSGLSRHETAIAMSYFLEEIVSELCRGHIVRIPGFGLFVARLWDKRLPPRCYPDFEPSPAFRSQVIHEAPITRAGRDAMQRFRYGTVRRKTGASQGSVRGVNKRVADRRVYSTMHTFRQAIEKDRRKWLGLPRRKQADSGR